MKNYEKPLILNMGTYEGVYAASGDCYTVNARVVQRPATGNLNFVIQMNGQHGPKADHHSTGQVLTITFNKAVDFKECYGNGATYMSGSGTNTLKISYTYHNNSTDNIGLGDLKVMTVDGSWDGLEVTSAVLACNYDCAQHNYLPNYPD